MSNTITAFFKGRVGVAEAVYQNDYGLVMNLDGLDLPAHFDCYFSTLEQDEAIPGIGADNQVVIPNDCLSRAGNVTLHIPLHTGQNDSEVEYIVYFKVIGRARPVDDGTPVQMTAIEQALALLQNPIGNIEQIVNEALAFTGDTFDEMKQELQDDFDNYTETLEGDLATWKGGVESDIDDVEHDFTVLQNQFDTAVAAVSTDTELTDIRVGDDEVTYTTAGLAVRTQFSNLKSDLSQMYGYQYSKAGFVLMHISTNGNITSNSNRNCVFVDPVIALKGSSFYVDSGYKYQYALYNISTGTFIRRATWITGETVTTLDSDYLIRIEISDTSESVLSDTSISEHLHYTLYASKEYPFEESTIAFNADAKIDLNYSIGETVNVTPASLTTYRSAIVNCQENDIFIINATGGSTPRVWAFVDENNILLAIAESETAQVAQVDLMLVAPSGASKLIVNDLKTGGVCKKYGIVVDHTHWIKEIKDTYIDQIKYEDALAQMSNIVKALGLRAFANKTINITPKYKYAAWPFVVPVGNKLLCVYSRGLSHNDNVYPEVYAKCSNDGIVWSTEKLIINTLGVRDTVTGKGSDSDDDAIFWNRRGNPAASSVQYDLYKTSDGDTFTKVSSPTFGTPCGHIGDIIKVDTVGLMAFFNTYYGTTVSWGIVTSANDGTTWNQTVVESGLTNAERPTEISGAYLGNGKIIAMGRKNAWDSADTYRMFQLQSDDYGQTWEKYYTNIDDINDSTPSLIYDDETQTLSVYYYNRLTGKLYKRVSSVENVWDNPTNWDASTVIAEANTGQDAGNANATLFDDSQIVAFYSGDASDTAIYGTVV